MQGWEQQVRTGHPQADQAEVQRLEHTARSQGLAVAVLPLPSGGFHVRAYPTWAASPQAMHTPPQAAHPGPAPGMAPAQAAPGAAPGPAAPDALAGPLAAAGYLATPEGQESIRTTLHYAAQGSPMQILADLGQLGALDKSSEKLQKKWGWLSGGGCFVGIVALVFVVMVPPLLVLCVLGTALFGFGIWRYGKYKKTNLEDRRYQLAARVVRLLSADMDPATPMKLSLALGAIDRKECAIGENQVMGWNVTYYRDPWLSVAGRLADGSSFKLDKTQLLQIRKKRKVNYRGKVKHKRKDKHGVLCTLTMKYKESRYPGMAQLAPTAVQAVQLPHEAQLKGLVPQPGSLTMKVASKVPWQVPAPGTQNYQVLNAVDLVAMMFLSIYQVLNLAKRVGGQPQAPRA